MYIVTITTMITKNDYNNSDEHIDNNQNISTCCNMISDVCGAPRDGRAESTQVVMWMFIPVLSRCKDTIHVYIYNVYMYIYIAYIPYTPYIPYMYMYVYIYICIYI